MGLSCTYIHVSCMSVLEVRCGSVLYIHTCVMYVCLGGEMSDTHLSAEMCVCRESAEMCV